MTATLKDMTSSFTPSNAAPGATSGAGYAKGFLDFAVSKGAPRDKLLELAKIDARDIDDLDKRIPLASYVALVEAGAALLNEPAIALQYGEAVRMQDISIVGLICEACETTIEVGTQLNRYWRLVLDGDESAPAGIVRLVKQDDGLWMEVTSRVFNSNPRMVEAEFARLVWNTRTMFASNAEFQKIGFPLAVQFSYDEPPYRAEYDRVFGVPLEFGTKWNAIRVDPRFLSLKQPPVSRYVFGVLSERAKAMLKSLENAKTTRGRVESLLILVLHQGEPSIERISEKMGLSRPTLYRRLKAEGITFEKLLDELRHQMALHYLNDKKVSVNETAYLIGFSDPSAFSRAFKRWTGKSPRESRRLSPA
ncbi:MAG: helix-turn-helix domain-containing protein [Alphaproteobacteria bacterium]|nr:helix-turn-helix domain-containing protein [Alphaproteobacteria bacterium]